MPWFNVDDGFANSKPVLRIPRRYRCAAIGLWTLAGSWSAKELTDGFIPDEALEEFASTTAMAGMLVKAGLWAKVDGGWQFEGWSKWQKTKEKVLAYREREADKKRNARAKSQSAVRPTNGLVDSYSDRDRIVNGFSSSEPGAPGSKQVTPSRPETAGSESVSPGDSLGTEPRVPQGQDRESPMCPGQPLPTPLPTPKPQEKDDVPLPPEPPVDDWVAGEVVVDAPTVIDNPPKPAKRYASPAAKSVVRQELGNDYSDAALNRLGVQVENLSRQGKPDHLIRETLREWERRPNCEKPEFIPTVYDDLVKAQRTETNVTAFDRKKAHNAAIFQALGDQPSNPELLA